MELDNLYSNRAYRSGYHVSRALPVRNSAPVTGRRAWLAERSDGARWHAGIDLTGRPGSSVFAPENGVVDLVLENADATPGWRGYGPGVVRIRGASGAWHVLAHIIPRASVGDVVQLGAQVGEQSSYRHVHWEVRAAPQPTQARAVVEDVCDPLAWVEGRIVRWPGTCPPRPGDTYRTPRACRPSWRGPRPAPLIPWPAPPGAPPGAPPSAATSPPPRAPAPPRSRRTPSAGAEGWLWVTVLGLVALAAMKSSRRLRA